MQIRDDDDLAMKLRPSYNTAKIDRPRNVQVAPLYSMHNWGSGRFAIHFAFTPTLSSLSTYCTSNQLSTTHNPLQDTSIGNDITADMSQLPEFLSSSPSPPKRISSTPLKDSSFLSANLPFGRDTPEGLPPPQPETPQPSLHSA